MKTQALRQALDKHQFDAAFGGARRDEESLEPKSESFHFVQHSTVGTLKINALNYGHFTTQKKAGRINPCFSII